MYEIARRVNKSGLQGSVFPAALCHFWMRTHKIFHCVATKGVVPEAYMCTHSQSHKLTITLTSVHAKRCMFYTYKNRTFSELVLDHAVTDKTLIMF